MAKRYDVTVWRDLTHYGVIEVEATSAAAAIEKVRNDKDAIDDCDMEDCSGDFQPVHYISARPLEDCPNATEGDEAELDLNHTHNAARTMLAALEAITVSANAVVDCWERGDLAGAVNMLDADSDLVAAAIAQARAAGITTPET